VNSNPETVSTDFDASARLYFDPLDEESIAAIIDNEASEEGAAYLGTPTVPVLVQFGGQTALNLADRLAAMGGEIAGTSADAIALAEDRRRFHDFADALGIPQPPGGTAESPAEALAIAKEIGYPVLVRPSYVLGGRGMEIAYGPDDLARYFRSALEAGTGRVLVDKYLHGKEVGVDARGRGLRPRRRALAHRVARRPQGPGVLHGEAARGGHVPRTGDEEHRRGDGCRPHVRPSALEVARRRRSRACAEREGARDSRRQGQGRGGAGHRGLSLARVRDRRDSGHRGAGSPGGHRRH